MRADPSHTDDLSITFAQQRKLLLRHAADVLCGDDSAVRQDVEDRQAKLSAILVSSLEELKVAEEELLERADALTSMRSNLDERLRYARELFDLSPACLLVTDMYGSILEANRASAMLFKRAVDSLERQLLVSLIPPAERRAFRDGLCRIVEMDGVTDWRFLLLRPTAGALNVSAAVRVVRPERGAGPTRLFWSIRVLDPAEASTAIA